MSVILGLEPSQKFGVGGGWWVEGGGGQKTEFRFGPNLGLGT